MIEYREKHGNLIFRGKITAEEHALKLWFGTQHKFIRAQKMSKERMEKLKAANFTWDPEDTYEARWERKYAELIAFYETKGHLTIPNKKDPLAKWIAQHQRLHKYGILRQDRLEKLNKVPFLWIEPEVQHEVPDEDDKFDNSTTDVLLERWKARFKELCEFKEKFGVIHVPKPYNLKLHKWVVHQRQLHHLGKLPKTRVAKLDSIGFVWRTGADIETDEEWNKMYKRLIDFKERHGSFNFAKKNVRLWVRMQQTTQCRNRPDRRALLEAIGFPFPECDNSSKSVLTGPIPRKRPAPDSDEAYVEKKKPSQECEHLSRLLLTRPIQRKRPSPGSDEQSVKKKKPSQECENSSSLPLTRPIRRKRPAPDSDKVHVEEKKPSEERKNSSSLPPARPIRPIRRERPAPVYLSDSGEEYIEKAKPTLEEIQLARAARKARRDEEIYERARMDSALHVARTTQELPKVSSPEAVNKPAAKNQGSPPQNNVSSRQNNSSSPQNKAPSPKNKVNNVQSPESDDPYPVGTQLLNFFPGHGWYKGTV